MTVATVPLGRDVFEAAFRHVAPHIASHAAAVIAHVQRANGIQRPAQGGDVPAHRVVQDSRSAEQVLSLSDEERQRGVVCSSAGNHAQGVALAARIHGIHAVVVMAENATPSKIEATRGYGAEVVLHGTIWDEANEKAKELVRDRGLTYVHPFDDPH